MFGSSQAIPSKRCLMGQITALNHIDDVIPISLVTREVPYQSGHAPEDVLSLRETSITAIVSIRDSGYSSMDLARQRLATTLQLPPYWMLRLALLRAQHQ
eukprot:scaffold2590_cov160-Amphora_coffeaeformis.AAC.9